MIWVRYKKEVSDSDLLFFSIFPLCRTVHNGVVYKMILKEPVLEASGQCAGGHICPCYGHTVKSYESPPIFAINRYIGYNTAVFQIRYVLRRIRILLFFSSVAFKMPTKNKLIFKFFLLSSYCKYIYISCRR
jgi:hypothetical protein